MVVALSGGLDSVTLLCILNRLRAEHPFDLGALHVNHGLSPNAGSWQAFCEKLCAAWSIPFESRLVRVERNSHDGIEAAARRARYHAFGRCRADWLALAHHRDDQAETLLLNLLRGAGMAGAAAMPVVRPLSDPGGPTLLRPLLDAARADLVAYAQNERLAWIEDESNQDLHHARNFLRHGVLPLLRQRFPGCDAALARAGTTFAECNSLLTALAHIDAASSVRDGRLIAAKLAKLDDARACNLLRHVLHEEGIAMPDRARLCEILRQIRTAAPSRTLRFDLGARILRRYRGEVWLSAPDDIPQERIWHGEEILAWGGGAMRFAQCTGAGIARDRLVGGAVRIAPRSGGERIRPDARRPRRGLRKLFQEQAVPPWQRDVLPLLWCGDELVWVAGIGVDAAWQCAPDEPGLVPTWRRVVE